MENLGLAGGTDEIFIFIAFLQGNHLDTRAFREAELYYKTIPSFLYLPFPNQMKFHQFVPVTSIKFKCSTFKSF
jgi:hypothetical protein